MMETVGFAFLAGVGVGVIGATCFIAHAFDEAMKRRIRGGAMENDGIVYRITRMD